VLLAEFNSARDDDHLRAVLAKCCAAQTWVTRIVAGRPYADRTALHRASDAATAQLDDAALAEALAGHPRIGDRPREAWSQQEQAAMSDADDHVRAQLAECNAAYEQRFGHVYLVCATGRTAAELRALCQARLGNDSGTERGVVLDELAKINRIRLDKLTAEES
jgi:2-oxo-4-hydroxy-4-carboxy-5-ureidoimidazoline decarboxylase